MKHAFGQALTGIGLAVLAAVTGIWLFFSVPAIGWQALVVPTGSMRPGMPPGSLAVVHQVPAASLRAGDVITYVNPLRPQQTITHRIIKTYLIGGHVRGFITKGDANTVPDPAIAAGSIRGEVVWHASFLGTAVLWAKGWAGIALLVYLPALIIILQEFRRLRSYYAQAIPYRLAVYADRWRRFPTHTYWKLAPTTALVAMALISTLWSPNVLAQLHAGPVILDNNRLVRAPRPSTCSNTNDVNLTTNTTQSASSGAARGTGARSGTASNSNTTNVTVTIQNGC